jgi:hypothetical protein
VALIAYFDRRAWHVSEFRNYLPSPALPRFNQAGGTAKLYALSHVLCQGIGIEETGFAPWVDDRAIGKVVERFRALRTQAAGNARLATADGSHRAFIDPRCVALIEDLEMRSYKPCTMELPADEGGRGHVSDAWSYPICRIWPIRFNVGGDRKQSVIVGQTRSLAAGNER